MGKIPVKPKKSLMSKPTLVKQNACRKPLPKVSSKRLQMLQRRISSLLTERSALSEKNNELFNNLKAEKLLSASYRKESFEWQKKYHECMIALNTYKVKQAETLQTLSTCLEDINSIYPNMVAFSESVTSNKIRITNLFTSLHSSDANFLPRQFRDMGKVSGDSLKRNEKPMKQRVGPMVKGFLITKPKIILERLMLPQPQDQDPINADMSTMEVNPTLPTIPEEDEHEGDVRLRHISVRPKRRLGRPWQVRKKDKTENERARDRGGNTQASRVAYDGDSTDSESNPAAIDHMEPVVRFKDVSRLLQNSSLLKMDSARTGEGESAGGSSNRQSDAEPPRRSSVNNPMQRTPDDPLEGSSWMFNQNNHNHLSNFRRPHKSDRRSSLYKSDSSDDDDNVVLQQNVTQDLSRNSLMSTNKTFTVGSKKRSSSTSVEMVTKSLSGSPKVEPDSTNDVNVELLNNLTFKNSLESSHRNSSPSSSVDRNCFSSSDSSVEHNSSNSEKKVSNNRNSLTVSLLKIPNDSTSPSSSSSYIQTPTKRHSSTVGGDSTPKEIAEKRLVKRERKPKCHLYPGEEELPEPPKTKNLNLKKVSTVKKSLGDDKKIKKAAAKLRLSSVANSSENEDNNTNDSGNKRRQGSVGGAKLKKRPTTKKSSMKKSLCTSRTSSMDGFQPLLGTEDDVSRPRRKKSKICYKESPLNVKQRRP